MRVLAALSGGVDSAVAAARARDAGHDVVGVHLALSKVAHVSGSRGCCSAEDARDARRVADMLDIPYYVWDMHEEFRESVIDDFIAEYQAGHTPNPCLRCNESIKFAAVLDRALALGFDAVSTGHYARLIDTPDGRELHRAVDPAKDQSYVLAVLQADQLAHSMFPLGESFKDDVRAEAHDRGLLVAAKPDSHDICFIPDGDTAAWLRDRLGEQPGDIVDAQTGDRVGAHQGAYAFTIGQRRGLSLAAPAAEGERRYVVDVDVRSNTVFVGSADLLGIATIEAIDPRWTQTPVSSPFDATVQVRAHGEPLSATVDILDDRHLDDGYPGENRGARWRIRLHETLRGVAPGQAAVLYDGTRVLGSATIHATAP